MIWLTWRQFRTQAFVGAITLAALAVALLATEPQLRRIYADSGLAGCRASCGTQADLFRTMVGSHAPDIVFNLGLAAIFLLPGIVGVFWGAPLVAREVESGTHRLVWNQSVTRTRWLVVKLLAGALTTVAVIELFTVAFWWWARPIDRAGVSPLAENVFGARGVVPIGYAAFAFTLGVLLGTLVRRTLPAMALTLVIVAFAQIAMPVWVRAHLLPPEQGTVALNTDAVKGFGISDRGQNMFIEAGIDKPGAWILSNRIVNPDGTPFVGPANPTYCGRDEGPRQCLQWINTLHLRQVYTYQPASRFWPLQWMETGMFLVLAAILAGGCFWWVRRRLS